MKFLKRILCVVLIGSFFLGSKALHSNQIRQATTRAINSLEGLQISLSDLAQTLTSIVFQKSQSADATPKPRPADAAPEEPGFVSAYLFHQQVCSTCFISPMWNLNILEKFKKDSSGNVDTNQLKKSPRSKWATKRIWFGRMYKPFALWHQMFQRCSEKANFKKFIQGGLNSGPIMPHFYDDRLQCDPLPPTPDWDEPEEKQKVFEKKAKKFEEEFDKKFTFRDSAPCYNQKTGNTETLNKFNAALCKILPFSYHPYFLAEVKVVNKVEFHPPGITLCDLEIMPQCHTKIPFYRDGKRGPSTNQIIEIRDPITKKIAHKIKVAAKVVGPAYYYGYIEKDDMYRKMLYYKYNEENDFEGTRDYNPEELYTTYKNGNYEDDTSFDEEFPKTMLNDGSLIDYNGYLNLKHWKHGTLYKTKDGETIYDPPYYVTTTLGVGDGHLGMRETATKSEPELTLTINGKNYSIYMTALYKFMLLRLGLDHENKQIKQGHKLYEAVQDIQETFDETSEHYWNKNNFKKETFLQYHLAELFKDQGLFNETKEAVDFAFPIWSTYERFIKRTKGEDPRKLYNDTGEELTYEKIKNYVPGPQQMLAYCLMINARLLWYGALNPKVFYEIIDKEYCSLLGLPNGFKDYKEKAKNFITVLNKIFKLLKQETSRKHFISFDGHGWVVSLDEKLIEIQNSNHNTSKCDDKDLLKKLPFAGIDSWHGSKLPTFYKKKLSEIK